MEKPDAKTSTSAKQPPAVDFIGFLLAQNVMVNLLPMGGTFEGTIVSWYVVGGLVLLLSAFEVVRFRRWGTRYIEPFVHGLGGGAASWTMVLLLARIGVGTLGMLFGLGMFLLLVVGLVPRPVADDAYMEDVDGPA